MYINSATDCFEFATNTMRVVESQFRDSKYLNLSKNIFFGITESFRAQTLDASDT